MLTNRKLPRFESWIDPGDGRIATTQKRKSKDQNIEQMKAAVFMMAAATKTEVIQGDRVLIAGAPRG